MQRALLWAILFTSCFLLWDNYQVYKGGQSFFHSEAVQQQSSADNSVPATKAPTAGDVAVMSRAFKLAVESGRLAYLSGTGRVLDRGEASSPLTGFLHD